MHKKAVYIQNLIQENGKKVRILVSNCRNIIFATELNITPFISFSVIISLISITQRVL